MLPVLRLAVGREKMSDKSGYCATKDAARTLRVRVRVRAM